MPRPRPRTLAIGALALLLAAAPFVPRGGDDDGALLPSGEQEQRGLAPAATAPLGSVSAANQAEIDRVLAQGRAAARTLGRVPVAQEPDRLAAALVRCAEFDGQRYCLHSGWTEDSETEVQARMATAARAVASRPQGRTTTGDLDELATLQRLARMDPSAREAQERSELTLAARSVAKVWLLRHEIEGVPIPAEFLAAHPEATTAAPGATSAQPAARTASASPTASATPTSDPSVQQRKHRRDYPQRSVVLDTQQVAEQQRTYWCGPTTMQMIAWGWKDKDLGQAHWADKLGTTTSGTAITDMVRVVNASTGWDRADHAGAYITLDIGDYTFGKWQLLLFRHIDDYHAPVVLHPILLKKYYPYLDDDASGHFQAGRGYDKRGKKSNQIGYFEPWNQQRFDPSEPYIARVQWRSAYKSYRANLAHFQHNIGV
ncbi:C39 family peptidase [Nocardioides sp. MAHUQ-72]|uniref:C39 family peptidase n=1 Tax=unclassified Nocardioides TaxID=2615069 RepID=UPI0036224E38